MDDYFPHKKGLYGKYSLCRECCRHRAKERYKETNRFTRSLKKYGLDYDSFMEIYNQQSGQCAICHTDLLPETTEFMKQSNVDHCHRTGKIRGILCHHCNRSLGMLRDNKDILRSAITYLDKYECN